MTTITFTATKATAHHDKAECELVLIGPSGRATIVDVLVDTGADYVMVPRYIASQIGLDLSHAKKVVVRGVGGSVTMDKLTGVSVEVEGKMGTADILFHPRRSSKPLVGRTGIRIIHEVAFEATDWHWQN